MAPLIAYLFFCAIILGVNIVVTLITTRKGNN